MKTVIFDKINLKILGIIMLLFVFTACKRKPQNNQETLDKIFSMKEFNVEIRNYGCFSDRTDKFELKLKGDFYELVSVDTRKSNKIELKEVDSLKQFFSDRFNKEQTGYCTGVLYIKVGNYFNSVDYTDRTCGDDWNILNGILRFTKIISNDNDNE